MMKSAPGRFSTITDCFQRLAKSSARVRATASGGPPAEPVMMRTVRSGQALSTSAAETAGAAAAITARNESILIGMHDNSPLSSQSVGDAGFIEVTEACLDVAICACPTPLGGLL